MFKYAKNREVLWPVVIQVPQDGGTVQEVTVKVRYKLLTRNEMAAAVRDAGDIKDTGGMIEQERLDATDNWLVDHITGWEDINDTDTQSPLIFSREMCLELMQSPYVRNAIDAGLWEASRGAQVKNSLPGVAG